MASRTSVIIPVRNGARFVAEAVRSVLGQLQSDDDVICIDDGSTDNTREVLSAIADPRLAVLDGGGKGVSAARNLGLKQAGGDLVCFLDHDDLWPAGRHAALIAAISARPETGAAFGRVRVRFEQDAPATDPAAGLDGKHIPELVGSGLYRAAAVRAIGGFAEDMRLREDADFHMRLVEGGLDPVLIQDETLIYRRHGANVTTDETAIRMALLDLARRNLARRKASNGS